MTYLGTIRDINQLQQPEKRACPPHSALHMRIDQVAALHENRSGSRSGSVIDYDAHKSINNFLPNVHKR